MANLPAQNALPSQPGNAVGPARIPPQGREAVIRAIAAATRDMECAVEELQLAADRATSVAFRNVEIQPDVDGDGDDPDDHSWLIRYTISPAVRQVMLDEVEEAVRQHARNYPPAHREALFAHAYVTSAIIDGRNQQVLVNGNVVTHAAPPSADNDYGIATSHRYRVRDFGPGPRIRRAQCEALVDELVGLLAHEAQRYQDGEVLWRFNHRDWTFRVVVAALRPITGVEGEGFYQAALRAHRPSDTHFAYETPADPHDTEGIWDGLDQIAPLRLQPPRAAARRAQYAVARPRAQQAAAPPAAVPAPPALAPRGYNLRPRNPRGRVGALSDYILRLLDHYPPRTKRSTQPDGYCALVATLDWLVSHTYNIHDFQLPTDAALAAERQQSYHTRLHTVQSRIARYSAAATERDTRLLFGAVRRHLKLGWGDALPAAVTRPYITMEEVRELCRDLGVWTACFSHEVAVSSIGRVLGEPLWVECGLPWGDPTFYAALMRGECNLLVWLPPERAGAAGHVFRILRPRQLYDGVQWCHVCRVSHATSDRPGHELVFCPQCDARLRARCLPRHLQICVPGGACAECGLSRTLHHRCVRHLQPAAAECRLLTRPDMLYWRDVRFDLEHVPGAKEQKLVDDCFKQARLALFSDEVREDRNAVLALVQRNIEDFLQLVYCYDFETVSPSEDLAPGGAAVRTASQVHQEVIPIVFCAYQARPYHGQPRRTCRFVGLDCAQRGATWLRQEAIAAQESAPYERVQESFRPLNRDRLHEAARGRGTANRGRYRSAGRRGAAPAAPPPEAEAELELGPDDHAPRVEAALEVAEGDLQLERARHQALADLHDMSEEGRAALAALRPSELEALERKAGMNVAVTAQLAEALRERPKWSILAVGFNSARFDLPLLLPEFPLEPVVQVNQGSDAFIKSVCVGGVKHVDLRLILGGSLAANYDSFRLPGDPVQGKWYTPFHLFNAIPRADLAAAETLQLPRPTWAEWSSAIPASDAAERERARLSWESTRVLETPGRWRPFQWFATYCESDCALLACLYRNSSLKLAMTIGVLPLFECSTMASAAALGNRRHARYTPGLQQVDYAPHQARLIRDALFGGICAVFAREAKGDCIALDVVSAYPAVCHQEGPLGGLPSGFIRNIPHYTGSGERLRPEDAALSADLREALRQRMRESLRVNTEGIRLLEELVRDHESRVFGWARCAVEVFITHPVTGLRQILGPIAIRTARGTVAYPVGCFYCTASLPTLREMEANRLGRLIRIYEGGYHTSPYPEGGESFPATSRMLLEKVLLSGYPAECGDDVEAQGRYREHVAKYFEVVLGGRPLQPDHIVLDKRRALVSKLCINAAWGFHVSRSRASSVILTGEMADELHGETFRRLYGLPVPQQLPFSTEEWERITASAHLPEEQRLAIYRECRHLKVLLERNAAEGAQRALPMVETPALSLGAAVPDAMRRRLGNFCHALNALGATVCYTDTDSVKIVLPEGCGWPQFRERLQAARTHPLLRRLLENGGGIGNLPGDFCPEGRFSEIVCLRPKGLAMRAYVPEKTYQQMAAPRGEPPVASEAFGRLWLERESQGADKVVFSGVRDDDVGVPDFAGMLALLRRADSDPDAFFEVTGQLTFRVSTSCAARGGSGAARGGLPAAMVGVVGDKQFRRARTLSGTVPEASRVFESERRTCATAHLTWPPGVHCVARQQGERDPWRTGRHEYVFTDDHTELALFSLPDDASSMDAELRHREELARRDRSVPLNCWERPRFFDARGVARAPTQMELEEELLRNPPVAGMAGHGVMPDLGSDLAPPPLLRGRRARPVPLAEEEEDEELMQPAVRRPRFNDPLAMELEPAGSDDFGDLLGLAAPEAEDDWFGGLF